MKIIFVGTTEFGIDTFDKLKELYEIPFVITQPDRPVGRKQSLSSPPVKTWAEKNNLPVLQPRKIIDIKPQIKAVEPDLMLVAAYGQIIPREVLEIPKHGSVNIHASLLPRYRGASPIQSALINGDAETGITLIKMDEKMDHGAIIATAKLPITNEDNFLSLYDKLGKMASQLSLQIVPQWLKGEIKAFAQDESKASYTKLLTRQNARINWSSPADEVLRFIKALNPKPGTWTTLNGQTLKILEAEKLIENKIELPGKIYRRDNQMAVKCTDYSLLIKSIQPEGKKPMSGTDFINGLKNLETKILI